MSSTRDSNEQRSAKTVISVNVVREHHNLVAGVLNAHERRTSRQEDLSYSEFARLMENAFYEVLATAHRYYTWRKPKAPPLAADVGPDKEKLDLSDFPDNPPLNLTLDQVGFVWDDTFLDLIRTEPPPDPETLEFWKHPALLAAYQLLENFVRTRPTFARITGRNTLEYLGLLVDDVFIERRESEAYERAMSEQENEMSWELGVEMETAYREKLRSFLPELGLAWLDQVLDFDSYILQERQDLPEELGAEPFKSIIANHPYLRSPEEVVAEAKRLFDFLKKILAYHSSEDVEEAKLTALINSERRKLAAFEEKNPRLVPEALSPEQLKNLPAKRRKVADEIFEGRWQLRRLEFWRQHIDFLRANALELTSMP